MRTERAKACLQLKFSVGQTVCLVPLGRPFLAQRPIILYSPCSYTRHIIQATQNSRTYKSPLQHEPRASTLTTHPIQRVRVTHQPSSPPSAKRRCTVYTLLHAKIISRFADCQAHLPSPPSPLTEIRSKPPTHPPTKPLPTELATSVVQYASPQRIPSDRPFRSPFKDDGIGTGGGGVPGGSAHQDSLMPFPNSTHHGVGAAARGGLATFTWVRRPGTGVLLAQDTGQGHVTADRGPDRRA